MGSAAKSVPTDGLRTDLKAIPDCPPLRCVIWIQLVSLDDVLSPPCMQEVHNACVQLQDRGNPGLESNYRR